MSDNYMLTEDNLNKIVLFNTLVGGFLDYRGNLADKLKKWDDVIFNELLKNQPELKIIYTQFQEEFQQAPHKNVLFTSLFSDKVKIESLKETIFKVSFSYKQDIQKRSDFFLELSEKSNFFYDTIFTEIKTRRDEDLFDTYFKIIKKIKNNPDFDKIDAVSNIKAYPDNYDLPSAKKKILAYLSIFDKNQEVYDLILEDMGNSFKRSASICNYWETKLKSFPQTVSEQFYNKKVSIPLFEEKQKHMYQTSLNPEWFVSEFKISNKSSQEFIKIFNHTLLDVVIENFAKQFDVNKEGNNLDTDFSLKFLTNTQEQMESVKLFSKKIIEQMPFIFKNHNMTKEYFEQKTQLKLLLEKCVFINTLDKNLHEKEVTIKKMKI